MPKCNRGPENQEFQEARAGGKFNMNKLTPRQERFCQEYIKDLNGKQAAIRAGYTAKSAEVTASKMLSIAKVSARVVELTAPAAKAAGLTKEYVLEGLKEVAERCRQGVPVMIKDENGKMIQSGEWKFDSAGANRALELLGKHLAIFTDKVEHSGGLTLEQLVAGSMKPEDKQ
jgi:phage terminase small subunit